MKVAATLNTLVVEVRDSSKQEVRFSALDYRMHQFFWKDKLMEERWWINLCAVSGEIILFTLYTDTHNPDKKAVIACSLRDGEVIWWHNDFSVTSISSETVVGFSEKFGRRELVLNLSTGKSVEMEVDAGEIVDVVIRPQQYAQGHSYFETVKTFFNQKFNLSPTVALEYLEYDSLIFISCYFQENELANYLFIISADGNLLLKEKLDVHLKGIGLDTFFVLDGYVFFVKNKMELVSYKIV